MRVRAAQPNRLGTRFKSAVRNSMPMRYPNLGLICLGVFIQLIGVGAIVPIRTIYARDHGATMAELGMMASGFLLGQFLMQFPGGWASDKWGRKPLLVFGIAVAGIISFLFLANDNPWYFIALRFIEGAAGGAIGPAANAYVIDAVPRKERGSAFGWLGSAFSAGFMLGPAIGGPLGDAFGYTAPFIFGGLISIGTAIFLAVKMRNPRPGAHPAEADEAAKEVEPRNERQVPLRYFKTALAGALVLALAGGFGDGIFISIWTLWLNDLHASNSFVGLTFVIFSLPLMVLMPFTGKFADKYRLAPLVMIPGMLISFIYLAYGFLTNLPVIAAIGIIEGTLLSISIPAQSAYVANLSPDDARGRLQGLITTVRTIAGFVSSLLTAVLYGMGMMYPWLALFAVQIVVSLVGGSIVWYIEKRTREANAALAAAEALPAEAPQALPRRSAAPVLDVAAK